MKRFSNMIYYIQQTCLPIQKKKKSQDIKLLQIGNILKGMRGSLNMNIGIKYIVLGVTLSIMTNFNTVMCSAVCPDIGHILQKMEKVPRV